MYIVFDRFDGYKPYIATTNKEAFSMFCKYFTEQINENTFRIGAKRGKKDFQKRKEIARETAIYWQLDFDKFNYSYGELYEWQCFFEEIGKKYGLLREFRENAII